MNLSFIKKTIFIYLPIILLFSNCQNNNNLQVPTNSLKQIKKAELDTLIQNISYENETLVKDSLKANIRYLSRRKGVAIKHSNLRITHKMLLETNKKMLHSLDSIRKNPKILTEEFVWFKFNSNFLLTGYYEPLIKASLKKKEGYEFPLYKKPNDLKTTNLSKFHPRWKGQKLIYRIENGKILPYYSREEIDSFGSLKGKKLEIAWAKDIVDVFVLQIQGSGKLILPNGDTKHILYAGKNGRKYVTIGKVLINKGYLPRENMSLQKIRYWLKANPDKIREILYTNPSYVFFYLNDKGPFGSMGNAIIPYSSVASDPKVLPTGSIALLNTQLPTKDPDRTRSFTRLIMAQDKGGAIKRKHLDLFCGSGEEAKFLAGHMAQDAQVYIPIDKKFFK